MITQKELDFIAENWLPHKSYNPYYWGKSLTEANPETYLAMYRGAIFSQKSRSSILYIKDINISSSSVFSTDTYIFTFQIMRDWTKHIHLSIEEYVSIRSARDTYNLIHQIIYFIYFPSVEEERIYTLS